MRALLRKELRELAWLGLSLALLWTLFWWLGIPVRGLLPPRGSRMELAGSLAIVLGACLGFAPFELERRTGMRTFLAHRGLQSRTIAWIRLAASCTWALGILGLGLVVVFALHLVPALEVTGLAPRVMVSLALMALPTFPALALGSLVGTLETRTWTRWIALVVACIGLYHLAGAASRWEIVRSPVGIGLFVALCVVTASGAAYVAVEYASASTCEDRPLPASARFGAGLLALGLSAPLFLQAVSGLQFVARGLAWSANEFWLRTAEGHVVQRAGSAEPMEPTSQWLTFYPADTIRLGESEQLLFHPVGGTSVWGGRTLGRDSSVLAGPRTWAIGPTVVHARHSVTDGDWVSWIDPEHERVVSRWWPRFGRPFFTSLPLPSTPGSEEVHDLGMVQLLPYGQRALVAMDGLGAPVAVLTDPPPWDSFRALRPFGAMEPMELVGAHEVVCTNWPEFPPQQEIGVFVSASGSFAFDGADLVPVSSFRETKYTHHSTRAGARAEVSAYNGLSYDFALFDVGSGEPLGTGHVRPRTTGERLFALAALAATLVRAPLSTIAAQVGFARDDDGASTPANSAWIDPLVLGGRRPWLVVLNQGLALVLAWLARRRLGGRAWGWPLAIVVLGVVAWLVCRVLEPKRAVARGGESPRIVPRWAPIADRAGA